MDKIKIMEFLYGEMSPEEEKEFRSILKEDTDLQNELLSLRTTRDFLGDHRDEYPSVKSVIIPAQKKRFLSSKWWAIAASLALLLVTARLLDLRVSIGNNQVAVQFGEHEKAPPENSAISKEQWEELTAGIAALRNDVTTRLDNYDTQWNEVNQKFINYQRQMAASIDDLKNNQDEMATDLWNTFKVDQKQHTEALVNDFVEYFDYQREQDLLRINESLNTLAQWIQLESDNKPQYVFQPVQK